MEVKELAKKMKELDLKAIDCKDCPFVGEDGECTFCNMCITNYEEILKMEEFFKEQKND